MLQVRACAHVCPEHVTVKGGRGAGRRVRVRTTRASPPGEHYVGVGVAGAGARRAPLDGVDLFAVSLQVVDTGLLLHTPNLHAETRAAGVEGQMASRATARSERYLQGHVVGAGGQQHARRIPLNGINFILPHTHTHTSLITPPSPLHPAGVV